MFFKVQKFLNMEYKELKRKKKNHCLLKVLKAQNFYVII